MAARHRASTLDRTRRARLAAPSLDSPRSGSARSGARSSPGWCCSSRSGSCSLPFSLADLWWQHHWGLGPFDVPAWLAAQWSTLAPEAVSAMATIVLLVGLAGRFRLLVARRVAGDRRRSRSSSRSCRAGSARPAAHPLQDPQLRSDVARIETVEHVERHTRARPGRLVVDEPGERLHGRVRAGRRTSSSGTRCSTAASRAARWMWWSPTSSGTCGAATS